MPLSDVVQVTITAASVAVSRAGFGEPLILGFHTLDVGAPRVRQYSSLTELITAGFTVNDPIHQAAAHIFAQNPAPPTVKVGRRDLVHTQDIQLTPQLTTEDLVYTITATLGGVSETYTYTVLLADTIALIVAGLVAAVNAGALLITATDNATDLSIAVDTPGQLVNYTAWNVAAELELKDITPDPGVATDLAAVILEDPDWYALVLDSNSEAEIAVAAAAIEAEATRKILLCNNADDEILDSVVTNDVMSDLQTASIARTAILYNKEVLGYAGAAWAGKQLPRDPGSSTWAFKTLALVAVDTLNTTQISSIEGKGGNHYTVLGGVSHTRTGIVASGEFIDIVRFIDFLTQRIQEDIFGLLVNNPKIPYTDQGVDLVRSEILKRLNQGIDSGAIADTPAPTVSAPLVANVATADRIARLLPDVTFEATLAGAIHELQIEGRLLV